MRKYENLAEKREQDMQKTAEKAVKQAAKDNSGEVDRKRPVYLSTLHPPHLQTSPHIRTTRDQIFGINSSYEYGRGYGYPFLVPVPIIFGGGVGLGDCVAAGGSLIDSFGSCGIGGFNGDVGCGGTADEDVACASNGNGEPSSLLFLYEC
jgi:hypothetical protein